MLRLAREFPVYSARASERRFALGVGFNEIGAPCDSDRRSLAMPLEERRIHGPRVPEQCVADPCGTRRAPGATRRRVESSIRAS
jgi:hypothetical protein